jgi:uroporphyrin-III C-methyltransferase/precorrin-2 dehydrogenase/sirohydrochlorin ferrochelatase
MPRKRGAGSVAIVGAGPGDPELLTLRALRALRSADAVLVDDLVAAGVLEFVRPGARKICVGKTGHGPSCKQETINALIVALAKSGERVVRLKGGDPMIFGRAAEEIEACRAAGIPVEMVPGISAAQAAASRLAVPLTDRRYARRLQFITGHGRLPDDIDWRSLADEATTTVVYMAGTTLAQLVATALAYGTDASLPAIAVVSATRPDERIVTARIAELPRELAAIRADGPVIVLIGRVCASATALEASRPPCRNV